MFKKPLWQTVSTQIRLLLGAVCSGSTLFASILNLSVMLGNYLQQMTSADDIFICIFFLALWGLKFGWMLNISQRLSTSEISSHFFNSAAWEIFQALFIVCWFFSKSIFSMNSFRNTVLSWVEHKKVNYSQAQISFNSVLWVHYI